MNYAPKPDPPRWFVVLMGTAMLLVVFLGSLLMAIVGGLG